VEPPVTAEHDPVIGARKQCHAVAHFTARFQWRAEIAFSQHVLVEIEYIATGVDEAHVVGKTGSSDDVDYWMIQFTADDSGFRAVLVGDPVDSNFRCLERQGSGAKREQRQSGYPGAQSFLHGVLPRHRRFGGRGRNLQALRARAYRISPEAYGFRNVIECRLKAGTGTAPASSPASSCGPFHCCSTRPEPS